MRTIFVDKTTRNQLIAAALLTIFIVLFFANYWPYPTRPGNDSLYPLGWLGWFDQGHYLRAVKAIERIDLSASAYYYPPLYQFLAHITNIFSKTDDFLIIDAACFLIYMASLLWVGLRMYGIAICIVPLAFFLFYPVPTLDQWIIPWTTSLSAALQGIMVAIYAHFEYRPKKFTLNIKADLALSFLFFLSYGAIFATRPLEVFVFFPLALIFFCKAFLPLAIKERRNAAGFLLATILGGIALPLSYLTFNRIVFGQWFGGYFDNVGSSGYQLSFFLEKAVSLIRDGGSLFLEPKSALSDHIQILFAALPIVLATALAGSGYPRIIAATICLNFAVYIPYGDLLPYGLFNYSNVHYFKWAIPWCAVIASGQLLVWIKDLAARRWLTPAVGLAISCLFAVAMAGAKIVVPQFDYVYENIDSDTNSVAVDFGETKRFRIVDLATAPQEFDKVYMGNFRLWVDGVPKRSIRDFRALPAPWGIRILLFKETNGQRIRFQTPPNTLKLSSGQGIARLGDEKVTLLCRWTDCPRQDFLPPETGIKGNKEQTKPALTISFALNGAEEYLGNGWSGPEHCCKWTIDRSADIVVPAQLIQPHRLEAVVFSLLAPTQRHQAIHLKVNDCIIAETVTAFPDDTGPNLLVGDIPDTCAHAGEKMRIAFETDQVTRPIDLGIGQDDRTLGVAVMSLSFW